MDSTALFCVVFGALIAATRGPLLLWPDATLEIYRQVASSPPLLRVFGGVLLALGSWLLQLWFDFGILHASGRRKQEGDQRYRTTPTPHSLLDPV